MNGYDLPAVLSKLETMAWFSACGRASTRWQTIDRWPVALRLLGELEWQNFTLELLNRYRDLFYAELSRQNRKMSDDEWNDRIERVEAAVDSIYLKRVVPGFPFSVPPVFRYTVQKEIRCMAVEAEFSRILAPPFFQPLLLPVYEAGRLPCGWSGDALPQGWRGKGLEDLAAGRLLVF